MPPEPDTDEIARRVNKLDELFSELHRVVTCLLEWKSKVSGGMTVMVWVIGGVQSVVLLCLGFAANALNTTASTLGMHAVELATAKAKIESVSADRFTAERNAVADATLKKELQEWVKDEIRHNKP